MSVVTTGTNPISAAFVDFLGSWCGTLPLGAENTKRRLTAPVTSGCFISTALCREWTGIQHPYGEYRPAVLLQFFSYPTSIFTPVKPKIKATNGHKYALKKRQEKGDPAMFSAPMMHTAYVILGLYLISASYLPSSAFIGFVCLTFTG
ncbi:MAG: hypothetical protein SPF30_00085, partial [Arcanobacterium sp.]|nr:hypothetical protein [Arcanobacterium sp.]